MNRAHKFRRLGKRNVFVVTGLILIFLCAVFIFFLRPASPSTIPRVNIVVATSPVSLWSWDKKEGTFIVVSLPDTTVIDTVHGYGKYSLEAIWKLGFIEKKDAPILAQSLSDAVGITIPWYLGSKSDMLTESSDSIAYGKTLFSTKRLVEFALGGFHTNMPLSLFMSFTKALTSARLDDIQVIDMSKKTITHSEDLPDGSQRDVLDSELLDAVLKGVFEDETIRKEGLSVALYNTTQTPALGTRASRLLSSNGVLVVSVGNEEGEVQQCQVIGGAEDLKSKTADVIAEILDCQKLPSEDQKRTDLTVRIGVNYQKLFQPH